MTTQTKKPTPPKTFRERFGECGASLQLSNDNLTICNTNLTTTTTNLTDTTVSLTTCRGALATCESGSQELLDVKSKASLLQKIVACATDVSKCTELCNLFSASEGGANMVFLLVKSDLHNSSLVSPKEIHSICGRSLAFGGEIFCNGTFKSSGTTPFGTPTTLPTGDAYCKAVGLGSECEASSDCIAV